MRHLGSTRWSGLPALLCSCLCGHGIQINSDIDLNTLPFVSFYKGCLEKDSRARGVNKPLLRWWLRLQVGPAEFNSG